MINKKFLIIILSSLFLLWNCDECSTCTNPPDEEDKILVNTSFEKNGNPSADGWNISPPPLGNFASDAPSGGGTYSVALEANNPFGGEAAITVKSLTDFDIYKLSFYAKFEKIYSTASLFLIRNGRVSKENTVFVTDTIWTLYSITDTFQTSAGDSIRILFRGGTTAVIAGKTLFDLCKLEAVE
ncbi:MAG: hypothetical protein DRI23_04660 [Candidatus Cloacimonadota bacterium]|nr:MAG: hypothetical protein DRI23_04660 [Candidatus Cloacimonadota bacterium]